MEITPEDIKGIIGLIFGFIVTLCMSGWLIYSLYIKPEQEEKKKQLSEKL